MTDALGEHPGTSHLQGSLQLLGSGRSCVRNDLHLRPGGLPYRGALTDAHLTQPHRSHANPTKNSPFFWGQLAACGDLPRLGSVMSCSSHYLPRTLSRGLGLSNLVKFRILHHRSKCVISELQRGEWESMRSLCASVGPQRLLENKAVFQRVAWKQEGFGLGDGSVCGVVKSRRRYGFKSFLQATLLCWNSRE